MVDVNRLLKQFEQMQALTKQMSGKNMKKLMSGKKPRKGLFGF